MPIIKHFRYRPEIDGLRAIAVIAVVLFHAGLGVPGGYVGVDIFFVISGYLITSLILKDLQRDQFSLVDFWERRARRILPASIVMVVVTAVAGWFLLLPSDFVAFGKSAASQAVFAANFYFWRNTNYFAGPADEQPLLHTWSLAVEEQFYMVVPFLLLFLFRFRWARSRYALLSLLGGGFVASLSLSVFLLPRMPAVTFYLLPTRAWELLAGSLIALLPAVRLPRWGGELLSGLGLAAMVLPCFLYDKQTPFPGLAALPPCLGAALFIWASGDCSTEALKHRNTVSQILSARPVVFIGLISYSLYLWHWPIVAFSHYWALEELSLPYRWTMVFVSMVLAVLSWRFVETPFRRKSLGKKRTTMFSYAIVGLAMVTAIGFLSIQNVGFPSRFSERILAFDATKSEGKQRFEIAKPTSLEVARRGDFPRLGAPPPAPVELLVWGDSHSRAILPGLAASAEEMNLGLLSVWNSSTPPVLDFIPPDRFSKGSEAPAINAEILRQIEVQGIRKVLLAARWHEHFKGEKRASEFRQSLQKTVQELTQLGCRVWILMEVPCHYASVPKVLSHGELFGNDVLCYSCDRSGFERQNRGLLQLGDYLTQQGVTLIDPSSILWDVESERFAAEINGQALYYDNQHLSTFGARTIAPIFDGILEP